MKAVYLAAWLIIGAFVGWSVNLLLDMQEIWRLSSGMHHLRKEVVTLGDAWRNLSRPGNDVLENFDVPPQRAALDRYEASYATLFTEARRLAAGNRKVDAALEHLDAEKRELSSLARRILALADAHERLRGAGSDPARLLAKQTEAARNMAQMDQVFQRGLDLLLNADVYIVEAERRLEHRQQGNLRSLYVMLLAALVISALAMWLLHRNLRQQEALRHSAARINAIVNNAVDGIISVDEAGLIESFNPTASEMFDYRPEEVIGRHYSLLLDEDADQRLAYLSTPPAERRGPVPREGQHERVGKRKNGSRFPMEISASAVRLGESWLTIHIVRDITERKRAEDELRQAAIVYGNTSEGIMITNARGTIQSVNPAFSSITGYAPEEAVGRTPKLLRSGRHGKDFYDRMWGSLRKAGHWQGEVWNRRKNGEVYPQWLNVTAIRDQSGATTNYVGVTWDISEIKASEQIKDEFIATVSHELRTPLTSIRGSLGLIVGGVVGEIPLQAKNLIQIAHDNSERLARLIDDILDIEKMEAGKLEFQLRPLEVMPLIEDSIAANRAYGARFGVEFAVIESLPGVHILADADRLMQVLANLMSNAAKFAPSGDRVEVTVTDQGRAIRVSVTDHGPGIPKQFQPLVFEKFAQADASNTRKKGGSGLGLSICKIIVDALGGRIGFTSEPNRRTTFYFELPRLDLDARRSEGEARTEEPAERTVQMDLIGTGGTG